MENTYFAFGINGQNFPILIKEKVVDFMEKILNDDDFITILEDKRGVHRIRKMENMTARRCGGSKYDTDTRSCWKQRRQQYSFADNEWKSTPLKVFNS